jgi:stress-induced morphogen
MLHDPPVIAPQDIEQRIRSAVAGARVVVEDLTGTADHYRITVVAPEFDGLTSLQRHRLVQASLRDVLGGALHAIQLTTRTPEEAGAQP